MKRSAGTILFFIILAGILLRLGIILWSGTYRHPHTWEYEQIANNILNGTGFVYHHFGDVPYRSFNNPLYGYLCAGIYYMTGHSYLAVLLIQTLFTALLAILIYDLARHMAGVVAGLIAAGFTIFHPGFIYYDTFNLIPLSIDTFFIVASTVFFLRCLEKPNAFRFFLTGAVIGLGTLSRGVIGSLLPFLCGYILFSVRKLCFIRRCALVFFLILGTILVVLPWVARNYYIHRSILIITPSSEALWRGNNELATGTSLTKEGVPIFDLWSKEFRKKVFSLDEMGQKKFFEAETAAFIAKHPVRVFALFIKKVYYFLWFSPQSGKLYPKIFLIFYEILYAALLLLAIIGFILARNGRFGNSGAESAKVLLCVIIAICLSQSVFYVEGRHRWTIEPLLMVFVAAGLSWLILPRKSGHNKELVLE